MLSQMHSADPAIPLESLPKRVRVLHIVESLDNQAVESWLMRVLAVAACAYPNIEWTFFTTKTSEGEFDETARQLGAEIIHSKHEIGEKFRFVRSLREVMKHGAYDILHCHHDVMSAPYLLASRGLPFKKRIVQVHNTSLSLPTPNRLKASVMREPMRQVCLKMADQIVGISNDALVSLVGDSALEPSRHSVVHYAIDTERFAKVSPPREQLRRTLGIHQTAKLVLFVGRIIEYKNPAFVLNMLEHLIEMIPDVAVVFAGCGDQESELQKLAKQKGLEDRVRLLGFRRDVAELMLASDLLVWPSLEEPKEGLGLGIIEAQAAGLSILMSCSVPDEAVVIPDLVVSLPLAAGAHSWAVQAAEILQRPRPSREESLQRVEASSFSMAAGVADLMNLYAVQRNPL